MTWLASQLSRRILFLVPTQTPNAAGGLTQTYKQLARVWAGVKPVSMSAGSYVRNVQIGDAPTHEFTVRRSIPMGVDTYGTGFVKADNFVFLLSSATPTVGRLFRILSAANVDEIDESIKFLAKEIGQLDAQKGIVQ
jgi:hypothetical protein